MIFPVTIMRRALLLPASFVSLAVFAGEPPAFVPLPAKVGIAEGGFRIDSHTVVNAPESLKNEADFLVAKLAAMTGGAGRGTGAGIALAIDPALPEEGYDLVVTRSGVTVRGGSPAGVFYGVGTFLQTIDTAAGKVREAPCLHVADAPAMSWRGVMLDSARHFQPKEFILKFLDAMAAYKLNRFHWHLTDCEGWRIEITRYPALARHGADAPPYYAVEIPTNRSFRPHYRYGVPHGGFYSQADIREIVAHAAARHIVVVPEIDIPGHADAALAAYPQFSALRDSPDYYRKHPRRLFGVDAGSREFLKNVLDEVMDLFPGKWIHLGGDEAFRYGGAWKNDPEVRAYAGTVPPSPGDPHALEHAAHLRLFNELAAHLGKRGRTALGWEEIAARANLAGLDKRAVPMIWLGKSQPARLTGAGFDVIMADGFSLYLDSIQSRSPAEPAAMYRTPFTAEAIRNFDFYPDSVAPDARKHILGGQVSLWTELMPRTDDVEYQAFPRLCAFAEAAWTPADVRKASSDFPERLEKNDARLGAMGLNRRRFTAKETAAAKSGE